MSERWFPYRSIKLGSRVVLFGAGKIGTAFWKQNQWLQWCDICLVVDTNYLEIQNFPVQVSAPDELYKLECIDYVFIAILDERMRKEVRQKLIAGGVPTEKIIEDLHFFEDEDDFEGIVYDDGDIHMLDGILKIGLCFLGSMGDCIIFLKFYQELIQIAPKSIVDIFYTDRHDLESIMYGQKNLGCVKKEMLTVPEYRQYDAIIQLRFEPVLLWLNSRKVQDLCPELARRLLLLYEYQKLDSTRSMIFQYSNRIILDRAKLCGWNRYTIMRAGGAFDIDDMHVDFYANEEYKDKFESLRISAPYMTFNYGANMIGREGKRQTKMWPYEYHVMLNKLLKERFPNVEIIQLGSADVERVQGADRYILGEPLEEVKWILKNAICHFDCEGGLVHMATQLGTKCFVVFGPTPVWFFGYDNNVNFPPKVCGECKGLIKDWYTRCYKYNRPECMYSIRPEDVFEKISDYLENKESLEE